MAERIQRLDQLPEEKLQSFDIVICTEQSIRCKRLNEIRELAKQGSGVIFVMPKDELVPGKRGYAKAQILEALNERIIVAAGPEEGVEPLLAGKYPKVQVWGHALSYQRKELSEKEFIARDFKVGETNSGEDIEFIEKAKRAAEKSDCWWRPTASLFVRDGQVVIVGVSRNVWDTDCRCLSLRPLDINLDPGERILFCNAIHSERAAVAKAARRGVSLENTCLYLTTGPCDDCAKGLIEAGVSRVVYELDPPDNEGLYLLFSKGVKLAKVSHE